MKKSSPLKRAFCVLVFSTFFLSISASAMSIYVDFDQPTGGPGVPLSTYSAAAPTPGTWNGVLAKDGVYGSATAVGALVDISGAALPGVFVDLGGSMQILPTVNAPPSLGVHQALLGDYFDTSPPAWLLQINGITNGTYDVYVYAPADPNLPSSAWSFSNGGPQPNLTGSTDGILNLGLDYWLAQTTVTNNAMILNSGLVAGGVAGPSGLSGIQLLQVTTVPIPAAVWLFGSALGLLGWMRRKAT
jgi:hypothetical protein